MKQNKHMLSGQPFPFRFEAKRKFGSKMRRKEAKNRSVRKGSHFASFPFDAKNFIGETGAP
jgi:hypothetical protein